MSSTLAKPKVRVIKAGEGSGETVQTAGFVRTELVAQAAEEGRSGVWIGTVRTPAGSVSGWHHHGEYDTYIYWQAGRARMEFGAGGGESCEAHAGDVVFVPRGAIHREANIGEGENVALLVRVGNGEPVFNTDRPEA
jgi:uncharacterized RmlC-like cupin family protein